MITTFHRMDCLVLHPHAAIHNDQNTPSEPSNLETGENAADMNNQIMANEQSRLQSATNSTNVNPTQLFPTDQQISLQSDQQCLAQCGYTCTCCRVMDANKHKYVFFLIANYDKDSPVMIRALKYRFSNPQTREMICRKCHISLKKLVLLKQAVSSPVKNSSCNTNRCVMCTLLVVNKMNVFRRENYGINPKLDCVLQGKSVPQEPIICFKCHTQFLRVSVHVCAVCGSPVQRRQTILVDNLGCPNFCTITGSLSQVRNQQIRICKACHNKRENVMVECLVCCRIWGTIRL